MDYEKFEQISPNIIPHAQVASGIVSNKQTWKAPKSKHNRALLVYVMSGVLHCEVGNDIWITPASGVLWLPSSCEHNAYAYGKFESQSVWVKDSFHMPSTCCIASISPLLRELMKRAASFSGTHSLDSPESRILSVIIDEIITLQWEKMRLPIPSSTRLRPLVDEIIAKPSLKATSKEWAKKYGFSERTMSRLFTQDVGMSFGRWKRQLHITLALQSLANGNSVQEVAFELGYENASSFIIMFKKTLGKPPGQYFADRKIEIVNK